MRFLLSLLVFSTLLVTALPAFAIKKCQDADGKWHYGDIAVEECENSKITTLTDRGFIKEEEAAPKTEAELRAEAEEQALMEKEEREKREAEEERAREAASAAIRLRFFSFLAVLPRIRLSA